MVLKGYKSQSVRSKWKVNQLLSLNDRLRNHLPETKWFTRTNFIAMVKHYPVLYVKPNIGTHGKGIIKIEKVSQDQFMVRSGSISKKYATVSKLYQAIASKLGKKKKHIVQEGIPLGTARERPFDLRMMFQRKPGGMWVCTGIFSKLGKKGRYVTNYHQGGTLTTFEETMAGYGLSEGKMEAMKRKLEELGLEIARTLHRNYRGMHEMGIDVGIDAYQHIWVIEVNSRRPQFYPLKWFKDKTMYKRMLRYAKSYGRPNGH